MRLGRGGAHEIKNHPFFRGVEFDSLRRIRAPFEPRLTSAIDTTYFPTDEIDQTDNATVPNPIFHFTYALFLALILCLID